MDGINTKLALVSTIMLLTSCGGADVSDNVINNYVEENNIVNNFYETTEEADDGSPETINNEGSSSTIIVTSLSQLAALDLKIGDTVEYNFSDGHLANLTGSTAKKIGTGQFEHYLIHHKTNFGVENKSIISTETLTDYLSAVNDFHEGSTPADDVNVLYQADLEKVNYDYILFENEYDGSRKRSGVVVRNENGERVVSTVYGEFYDTSGNITAREFQNRNMMNEFTPPVGNLRFEGTTFLQKVGSEDIFTGDVSLSVNFNTGRGSFSAPELSHNGGVAAASASGSYDLIGNTGLFIGTSQATILGETYTGGGIAGSFDSKANVAAAGIAKWDSYAGSIVVERSE